MNIPSSPSPCLESSWGHPSLRLHLHPALLHPQKHLVWVPVPGVHHFPHHLVLGHHPATSTCVKRTYWWWPSFLTSLFMAVYLFVYDVHYFFSKLQIISAATTIHYFTMIMVLIFFLFTRESTTEPHYTRLGFCRGAQINGVS
uniref:Uncharacterized protein n=1 Tax=Hucho hucho TaxID=62062 RepID=A0A4W5JNH4_9TELE